MTPDLLTALFTFALVAAVTPGPNNVLLLASGANYGLRGSLPHMSGVAFGFPAMVILVGLGVMQLFDLWPVSYAILKWLCVGYLIHLSWKVANAAAPGEGGTRRRPLTFLQAAVFQWVNPKAWTTALTGITLFAPARDLSAVLVVAAVYFLASLISVSSWTTIGTQLSRWLNSPSRLRWFNWTMATLLLATLIPVLWSGSK